MKSGPEKAITVAVYVATLAAIAWSAWRIVAAVRQYTGNDRPTAAAQKAQPEQQQGRRIATLPVAGSIRPINDKVRARMPAYLQPVQGVIEIARDHLNLSDWINA